MTASEEKNLPLDTQRIETVESPFLTQELFTQHTGEDRELRLDALEQESPFLQVSVPAFQEEIIGTDDRTIVQDTFGIPNRWICAIDIVTGNSSEHIRGTGVLIGPRYVLTAKHIWPHGNELFVSPARNGSNSNNPFGRTKAKRFHFPSLYYINLPLQHGNSGVTQAAIRQADDYMLIILKQDLAAKTHSGLQGMLGYWGQNPAQAAIQIPEPAAMQGKEIVVIGYPGDTCGAQKFSGSASQKLRAMNNCVRSRRNEWSSTQWRGTGILDLRTNVPNRLYHTADTYEGQSGSPIFMVTDQTVNLVGIHVDKESAQRNLGMRITERMLRNLCVWINADVGRSIASIQNNMLLVQPDGSAPANVKEFLGPLGEVQQQTEDFLEASESLDNKYESDVGPDLTEAEFGEGSLEFTEETNEEENPDLAEMQDEVLEENEFRIDQLPVNALQYFRNGSIAWPAAVSEAINAGIREPNALADLIFFMLHPERISGNVGKSISKSETNFVKLRAEWNEYRGIAAGLLTRSATPSSPVKSTGTVFLAANLSKNYEDYIAAPTTGRMSLMINGRNNSDGPGPSRDKAEAFDSMQAAVEALRQGDSIFLAAWHFDPTVPLTTSSPIKLQTWGVLFQKKAEEGVKIRIIMTDFDPIAKGLHAKVYRDFLPALNQLVGQLSPSQRDNLKYIVSRHPATYFKHQAATHHQKFMIVKKGGQTTAFCGGLDIAYLRTPAYWSKFPFLWHDVHTKLEGLIARDLEQEFILRWNREKDNSVVPAQPDWQPFETLVQAPASTLDQTVEHNSQQLQMLRTVSVQGAGLMSVQTTKRDDIWQGYLQLIGRAAQFIYMENQYFREPKLADAIVKQAKAKPKLTVIILVPEKLDDDDDVIRRHGSQLQREFFRRLLAGIPANRLRVYTIVNRIVHSKLIMVDDRALSVGSANANPRSFSLDTELNVVLDDTETVKNFRHRLWSHNLGVPQGMVANWGVADFMTRWDTIAKVNQRLASTPGNMTGEGIVRYDPLKVRGEKQPIPDVLTEV